jgi:hypothetical protein
MKMKRNNFLTFLFSLVPGAGHMFMGFMKIGVSLLAAFTLVIFLASWLDISSLLFILPLLWFYSFFDCINRRYSNDEEFAVLEDYYLFSIDKLLASGHQLLGIRRPLAGILLLLLGIYLVWNNLLLRMRSFGIFSDKALTIMKNVTSMAPQFILGIAIIIIGIRLIMGRKRERDLNA